MSTKQIVVGEGRRRMTARGRATIALGLALLAAAALALVRGAVGEPSDRVALAAADAHHEVSAAPASTEPASPAPVAAAAPPPPLAPLDLVSHPPVDRTAVTRTDPLTGRIVLEADPPVDRPDLPGPLRVETTLDGELTEAIWRVLERGRIALGHVVVMDPRSGAVLAYVSTDLERFPPTRTYPAASLIKVVTTAAALDAEPSVVRESCRYVGNQYRLSRQQVDPPRHGNVVSLRKALAMSNNQCFAQLAVHRIGSPALLDAIDRFGFLHPPALGHAAGVVEDPGQDAYALGMLGSGLNGTRITPLHAAQLVATLADGVRRTPRWVSGVLDVGGRPLVLPDEPEPQRVMTPSLARQLRDMMVDTTERGTARRAFRLRNGRPLLQGIEVAGKTGSLSGTDPDGRYEWFAGIAPADDPVLAVAVVSVHGPLFWMKASQAAAEVLKTAFCPEGSCRVDAAQRWLPPTPAVAAGTSSAAGTAGGS